MKKLITIILTAGIALATVGCTSEANVDPKTGVVKLDGMTANELAERYGLGYSFEVNIDPDTGAVDIGGTPINELGTGKKNIAPAVDAVKSGTSDNKAAESEAAGGKEGVPQEIKDCGITLTFPDTIGVIQADGSEIGYNKGVYLAQLSYIGVAKEWYAEKKDSDSRTAEENKKIDRSRVMLPSVFCVDKNRSLSEMISVIDKDGGGDRKKDERDFTKLGKSGEYTFYRYSPQTLKTQENIENLETDFAEEYGYISAHIDEIIGDAELYEPILKDKEGASRPEVKKGSDITPNTVGKYRIYVTDDAGNPVDKVRIQFCDDKVCRLGKTDQDGLALFDADAKLYEVHVLKVPEGYEETEEVWKMPASYSDLHIILKKKK